MASLKAFGASVNSYFANLGWNGQPTQLTIRVGEDFKDNDSFTNPNPGDIAYFSHASLRFGGHVQSRTRVNDFSANPLYEIVLVDPREILDGVKLILSDYNGSVYGAPNLWNVYGYWENRGFGSARLNDTGMPFSLVASAAQYFNSLVFADTYGGPIRFKNNIYRVDHSGIPGYSADYRVSGPSVSLLELILEVCNESGHDTFFELVATPTGNWITVRSVSRTFQPDLTRIASFVGNSQGAVSTDVGVELRNEKTSSFLVGGNRADLFQQTYNGEEGFSASIWPFWGVNTDNNAIVGVNSGNEHTFTVDSRSVNSPGIGSYYTLTVAELRAAIVGQDEWETFVAAVRPDIAERIALYPKFDTDLIGSLIGSPISPKELFLTSRNKAIHIQRGVNDREKDISRIYEFVRSYATEYYGRKFMVTIPYTFAYEDPDTFIISLSQEPTDAGFIQEGETALDLSTIGQDIFRTQDGRLGAFVRFENYQEIDLSQLDPDDYYIENGKLYLACSVEPYIVYVDSSTQYSPRAIITLPSPIYYLRDVEASFSNYFALYEYIIGKTLNRAITQTEKDQFDMNVNVPGALALFSGFGKLPVQPYKAAVPLKSNTECYGPWYAIGAVGKVEFEKNESLVPWNYGDYETMDLVGNALVQNGLTNMQVSELGNVTLPGEPVISLGDQLIAGGPYVTNMSVSVDVNGGITTSYSMRTFTPKYNPFIKSNIDTVSKLGRKNRQVRRAMREALRYTAPNSNKYQRRQDAYKVASRNSPHTPHEMIISKVINDKVSTSFGTIEQSIADLSAYEPSGYLSTAGAELGSLFVPYSTYHDNSADIPRFLAFSGLTDTINASSLNPFASGGLSIDLIVRGVGFPEDLSYSKDTIPLGGYNDYRGLAHRTPMILAGWGYDIGGSSVSGPTDSPINWKVGPLDCRWDEDRGVWEAGGGGGGNKIVKILDSGAFPTPTGNEVLNGAFMKVYRAMEYSVSFPEIEGSGVELTEGDILYVGNFRSNIISPNKYYSASKISGKWMIDNQSQFWELT